MNEIPGVAPAIEIPGVKNVDMKLEVVVIPVSDVDRAKSFDHETLGWRLDRDLKVSVDCRALQVTPLNSQCSVAFPTGVNDAEPAQAQGTLSRPRLREPSRTSMTPARSSSPAASM